MSGKVKTTLEGLAIEVARHRDRTNKAVLAGMRIGAERVRTLLVMRTPRYRGEMAAAWTIKQIANKVAKDAEIVRIYNDAPYAGVVESGARPHAMGREGLAAIARWAKRTLGVNDRDAVGIAFAVAAKIKKDGQEPTYFVKNSLDAIQRAVGQEVARKVRSAAKAAKGSK